MATRTSQPTRRRRTTTPARRRPAARRRRYNSPLAVIARAIGALWMGVAHGVGWIVRGLGTQAAKAKDLDPEHRRDGIGLLLLGLSVLLAAAIWGGDAGPLGEKLGRTIRFFIGTTSVVLPVLLAVSAIRLMRSAPEIGRAHV